MVSLLILPILIHLDYREHRDIPLSVFISLPFFTITLVLSTIFLGEIKANKFLVDNDVLQYRVDIKTGDISLEWIDRDI
jgi:hypothetical protein